MDSNYQYQHKVELSTQQASVQNVPFKTDKMMSTQIYPVLPCNRHTVQSRVTSK